MGKGNGEEGPCSHHSPKYPLWQGPCLGLSRGVLLSTASGNSVAPACPGDRDSPCLLNVMTCVFISVAVLFSKVSKSHPKGQGGPLWPSLGLGGRGDPGCSFPDNANVQRAALSRGWVGAQRQHVQ